MATKTRATNRPTAAHAAETLPGALALLNGLDQVARSLVPFEAGGTSLAQVVEGARRLLNPDGVAILIRDKDGEYTFMAAEGVLAEWRHFVLAGSGVELLDEFLKRDTVTLFQRKQRTAWAREFLFAAGMNWGALAPIRGQGEMIGALLVNHSAALPFHAEHVAAFRGLATLAGVAAREDSHRAHLEELFMSVIVSLTMALEAKDSATEGHSVRVAAYSEAIGKDGVGMLKHVTEYHNNVVPQMHSDEVAFHKRFPTSP